MNRRQKIVIVIGVGIVLAMMLFPPFLIDVPRGRFNQGYHFILNPPLKYATVNSGLLLVQWIGVLIMASLAVLLLRNPKSTSYEEEIKGPGPKNSVGGNTEANPTSNGVAGHKMKVNEPGLSNNAWGKKASGSGKKWYFYRKEGAKTEVVKGGFNWWAFLFVGFWALHRKLFMAGSMWITIIFMTIWHPRIVDLFVFPFHIVMMVIYGFMGNSWLRKRLANDEYELIRTISAPDRIVALSKFDTLSKIGVKNSGSTVK